jgi:YD repeat-containing protein
LWASPTEDDNGNAIRIPWAKQPDEAQDCVYDAWNRLVSVSQNGLPVAKYEYDGLGRLSRQISFDSQGKESERRNFVHDYAGRVIHEQVSQPVKGKFPPYLIDREHVWGPSGLLFRDRYRPDDSQFERLYAQQDVEGNVVALVSGGRQTATGKITPAPGKVQERYDYDPSARLTVLSPDYTPQANSQFDWNLLWQAGRRDPLTGVYVGGDGAYYERLGKSLNPEVGMAQAKATSRATITARSTPPTRRHSRCCNRQAKNSAGSRKGPCSSAAWQLALASGY